MSVLHSKIIVILKTCVCLATVKTKQEGGSLHLAFCNLKNVPCLIELLVDRDCQRCPEGRNLLVIYTRGPGFKSTRIPLSTISHSNLRSTVCPDESTLASYTFLISASLRNGC